MENLADVIAKVRIDQSNVVVSKEVLAELLDVLNDQKLDHIALDAFLQYVFDRNLAKTPRRSSMEPSDLSEVLDSPQFQFRTPMKPFTPFPVKSAENEVNKESLPKQGPFTLSPEDLKRTGDIQRGSVDDPTEKAESQPHQQSGGPTDLPKAETESKMSTNAPNGGTAGWFWGKGEKSSFATSFAEGMQASKNAPAAVPDAFSSSSWKEFKFELGSGGPIKPKGKSGVSVKSQAGKSLSATFREETGAFQSGSDVPETQSNSQADTSELPRRSFDSVPSQPLNSQETLKEERKNDTDGKEEQEPTISAINTSFTVHSRGDDDVLHALNEDGSTSQGSTTNFARNLFDQVMEDDDSEMSVEGDNTFTSPFVFPEASFEFPPAFAQKENTDHSNTAEPASESASQRSAPDSSSSFPLNNPFEKPSFTSTASSSTDNLFTFSSQQQQTSFAESLLTSQFASVKIGEGGGLSFSLGTGSGTTSRAQPSKRVAPKKKEPAVSSATSGKKGTALSQENKDGDASSNNAAGNHLFPNIFPHFDVGGGGSGISTHEKKPQQGTSASVFPMEASSSFTSQTQGDAPPAWWTASANTHAAEPKSSFIFETLSSTSPFSEPSTTNSTAKPNVDNDPSKKVPVNSNANATNNTYATQSPRRSTSSSSEPAAGVQQNTSSPLPPSACEPESEDKTISKILDVYSKQGKEFYSMGQYHS